MTALELVHSAEPDAPTAILTVSVDLLPPHLDAAAEELLIEFIKARPWRQPPDPGLGQIYPNILYLGEDVVRDVVDAVAAIDGPVVIVVCDLDQLAGMTDAVRAHAAVATLNGVFLGRVPRKTAFVRTYAESYGPGAGRLQSVPETDGAA